MPSTKFVFFGPIGKTIWPPWPLIGWDIFDFSSETAEGNSTKLDRKQDLNALCQVCVFRVDRKNKMAALASDWPRHFRLLLWNHWTEFNETWQEARSKRPLPSLCFSGRIGKKNMAALASDWLRHFPLLLWNCWTEFNETWREARSQRPLPSLCFSGRSEKQVGRPSLWFAKTFSTSPLKTAERNSTKLDRKQDLNALYQVCVFFGPIGKTRWPPWPLIGRDIFDFSSETAERNSTKLDRKQDLNALYQVCVFHVDRKNKMATPGLWFAETFSTFPLKPLNRIQQNLTGSKISTSSTRLAFRADQKNKITTLSSDWLRHFRLLLWNHRTEFKRNLTESNFSTSSTKFVFFRADPKKILPPWPLIGWDIFWLFLWNR